MKRYNEIIDKTRLLLSENSDWVESFKGHIKGITENKENIVNAYNKFRSSKPFAYYITTTEAKSGTYTFTFSMRFKGQEIATVKSSPAGITITTKTDTNLRDFNCSIPLQGEPWDSKEAAKFRKHFTDYTDNRNDTKKKNDEHRIEQALIEEFGKNKSEDKALTNIKPIKLTNSLRFPMPTAISASGGVKYSKHGGGIDLLCRRKEGNKSSLCVIELKDEYKNSEKPEKVLEQAVAYATFIRELLRSKSGATWYEFFGFDGAIPDGLKINVVVAMPFNSNGESDKSFANQVLNIEQDKLVLHYMYFDECLSKIETSL